MFTGIITDVGEVIATTQRETGIRLRVASNYTSDGIDMGASIAHSGICLTVVDKGPASDGIGGNRNWYDVEISPETLRVTTAGNWRVGTRLNLERSLTLGQEMGGHLVTGHVDGVAELVERTNDGDMAVLTFRVPESHARFIAAKGSICLDGTSLTVNSVGPDTLSVMLIPHTLTVTTWGDAATGDHMNFEVDLMARYAARLMDTQPKG
jgi:riboflavin synthase